jgi:hypothetical protein
MGGDRAIGGHTSNRHSFIAGARSADNFHAKHRLGERCAVPSRGKTSRRAMIQAEAFFHGFEHKPETTGYTCNEDICSHFIRNYRRRNFFDQVQSSPFQNSV